MVDVVENQFSVCVFFCCSCLFCSVLLRLLPKSLDVCSLRKKQQQQWCVLYLIKSPKYFCLNVWCSDMTMWKNILILCIFVCWLMYEDDFLIFFSRVYVSTSGILCELCCTATKDYIILGDWDVVMLLWQKRVDTFILTRNCNSMSFLGPFR